MKRSVSSLLFLGALSHAWVASASAVRVGKDRGGVSKTRTLETYPAVESGTENLPSDLEESSAVAPATPYDPVPADQVDALSKRLKLVEELIRKHGRAYDYRTLTIKELEALIEGLSAPKAPPSSES